MTNFPRCLTSRRSERRALFTVGVISPCSYHHPSAMRTTPPTPTPTPSLHGIDAIRFGISGFVMMFSTHRYGVFRALSPFLPVLACRLATGHLHGLLRVPAGVDNARAAARGGAGFIALWLGRCQKVFLGVPPLPRPGQVAASATHECDISGLNSSPLYGVGATWRHEDSNADMSLKEGTICQKPKDSTVNEEMRNTTNECPCTELHHFAASSQLLCEVACLQPRDGSRWALSITRHVCRSIRPRLSQSQLSRFGDALGPRSDQ